MISLVLLGTSETSKST